MPTVLITGAAVRIGASIARHLALCGYDLILHYHTSAEKINHLANNLRQCSGRDVVCLQADLIDPMGPDHLFNQIEDHGLKPEVLINNASLFNPDEAQTLTRSLWDQHMAIHGWTPACLSGRFARLYQKNFPNQTAGNIINLIDQRVKRMTPYFFSYTASKTMLWSLTQTMAMSFAPFIRVNGIAPGPTLANPRQSLEDFQKQAESLPLKRSIDPLEIAKAVVFLLESPSMTGNLLMIDAGQHLAWETPDVIDIQE